MPPDHFAAAPQSAAPAAARWRVRVLGGVEVVGHDGQRHTRFASRAIAALLARLAMAPERAHARVELVELLWPGVELAVGRNRLRQALSTLKSLLEPAGAAGTAPVLLADRVFVRVAPGALACDALEFDQACRERRWPQARELYGGELMPGHYDDWVDEQRLRLAALFDRLERPLEWQPGGAGDASGSPGAASHAAAASRRSSTSQAPMRAPPSASTSATPFAPQPLVPRYLTRGFGADAMRRRLRDAVAAHRLVTLLGPGGAGKTRLAAELALSVRQSPPAEAPFDLVLFVPLVGSAAAAEMAEQVLAALHAHARTHAPSQAQVQAPRSQALPAEAALQQALAGRHALVVLDNLEHLLPEAAAVVLRLVEALPQVHLLCTSRRLLEVEGELCFTLDALPLPPREATLAEAAASPAVQLFVDRARAARADFHLSARNAPVLAALVIALGGLPLALELAAARVRSFTPSEMLQRITRPLQAQRPAEATLANAGLKMSANAGLGMPANARLGTPANASLGTRADTSTATTADADPPPSRTPALDLLARPGPRGGRDARHASMEAVIAWSWAQLDAADARVLAACTVFGGPFSAAALAFVAGDDDTPLRLDALLSHSMLQRVGADDSADANRPPRFSPLPPVREFAAAQLTPQSGLSHRARHRQWLLQWAEGFGPTPPLAQLRAEIPNLAAALAGALLDGVPEEGLRMLVALRRALADMTLPPSLLNLLEQALQAGRGDDELRSRGYTQLGLLGARTGRPSARADVDQGLALAPQRSPVRARALHAAASVRWRLSADAAGALALLNQAHADAASDPETRASMLALRGAIAGGHERDHVRAEALHREAFALWLQLGNAHALTSGHYNLAICATRLRHWPDALAHLEAACASARALGDWQQLSLALNVLGNTRAGQRDWAPAYAAYREAAEQAWAAVETRALLYALWNAPLVLAHLRRPEPAARLMGFAATYWAANFGKLKADDLAEVKRARRLVKVQTGEGRCAALWDEGQSATLAEAVAWIRELNDRTPG